MPNPIKYTTGTESQALKKGNFYIGTGDVGKGPSDTTGFYQGVSPSEGGYVIYLNKEGAPGNLSYHNAANDSELISFTNNLAAQSYTSATQCLVYYTTQNDKVVLNRDYEGIVTDGLVLNLDAGFTPSYPKNGTTWYDVGGTNNVTLTNGPIFSGDSVVFDGVDDYGVLGDISQNSNSSTTIEVVMKNNSNVSNPNQNQINFMLNGQTSGSVDSAEQHTLVNNIFSTPLIVLKSRIQWSASQNLYSYQVYYQILGTGFNNYPILKQNYYNPNGTLNSSQVNFPQIIDETYHYCWVLTNSDLGTRSVKHYLNGQQISVLGNAHTSDFNFFNLPNLQVGRRCDSNMFVMRMYNRPLSASEVLQNYNAQKGRFGL
jgi:hypothetical protein